MREMIWLVSVLFAFLCSLCWSAVVFLVALPAALRWPIVVEVMPLSLVVSTASLLMWVAGLLAMWKIAIQLTERLVEWISRSDSEKKKKRPPMPLSSFEQDGNA